MILVIAGTQDGRELAVFLAAAGYPVTASVVSRYGKALYGAAGGIAVEDRPMDEAGLRAFFAARQIRAVVDASHPYAAEVSKNAIAACAAAGVLYIRYERAAAALPAYDKLTVAATAEEAAKAAAGWDGAVFLTTGSRRLDVFVRAPALAGRRLAVRVLPDAEVLRGCAALGLAPRDIVAMQGPFSHALNKALFESFEAGVVVMKNSGAVGGADTKITAAMELDLPLVVIERPRLAYPAVAAEREEVLTLLREE